MCWTFTFLLKPAINAISVEHTHTLQTRYGLTLLHVHKAYNAFTIQVLIQRVINPLNILTSIIIITNIL